MKGKKNLEKAIVMGLLLSASVYGTAWAEVQYEVNNEGTLVITTNERIDANREFDGKYMNDYENVEIHYTAPGDGQRPLGVYSARYDLINTNVTVYVDGKHGDNDSVHLTNHYPHF